MILRLMNLDNTFRCISYTIAYDTLDVNYLIMMSVLDLNSYNVQYTLLSFHLW